MADINHVGQPWTLVDKSQRPSGRRRPRRTLRLMPKRALQARDRAGSGWV